VMAGSRDFAIGMKLDPQTIKQVDRAMKLLPERAFERVCKGAASYAMTPVLKAARANAQQVADDGDLAASTIKKRKVYKPQGVIFVLVGPEDKVIVRQKNGKTVKKNPANYSHLVEYGTAPHEISSRFQGGTLNLGVVLVSGTVQHPGSAAKPVYRPAYHSQRMNVVKRYERKVVLGIEKEARKLGRGG